MKNRDCQAEACLRHEFFLLAHDRPPLVIRQPRCEAQGALHHTLQYTKQASNMCKSAARQITLICQIRID